MNKRCVVSVGLISLALTACSMNAEVDGTKDVEATARLEELAIKPEDWRAEIHTVNGLGVSKRTLKEEKLDLVRRSFKSPSVTQIALPESEGFELYEVRGYQELEEAYYVHPKLYVNTSTKNGTVLGYKTGEKDSFDRTLVEVSIPVALVNGLVPAVAVVGDSHGDNVAVSNLPKGYVISDKKKLEDALGKPVKALPVCPESFTLRFENKEYWADSPFRGLSFCPLNQMFRIKFKAPVEDMDRLLETAAVRDSAVSIQAALRMNVNVPKVITEVEVSPDKFNAELTQALGGLKKDKSGNYLLSDVEEIVTSTFFKIADRAGLSARVSADIIARTRALTVAYFKSPTSCGASGACTSFRGRTLQNEPIRFSWEETEALLAPIHTEAITNLSAAVNSQYFTAHPNYSVMDQVRKPVFFKSMNLDEIRLSCANYSLDGWPKEFEGKPIDYGTTEDFEYLKEYCSILVNLGVAPEGYYPFINETTVYPGAWIKLEKTEVAQLTTAKMTLDEDGTWLPESEVVDLLSVENASPSSMTTCLEGAETACAEYDTKSVVVRDHLGDPVIQDTPCERGTPGCECTYSDGKYECLKKTIVEKEVLRYECDYDDQFEFCPYWVDEKVEIGAEVTYDCKDMTVETRTTFLCLGGCGERHELICKESQRKPVTETKQRPLCRGFHPEGRMEPERGCHKPKYKCAKWNVNCTRYTVNEAFHIVHEEVVPQWRKFNIEKGENPPRFSEDLYLRFESPNRTVADCQLSKFHRELKGRYYYFKLPSIDEDTRHICNGVSLWTEENTKEGHFPTVSIRNDIKHSEERKCGRTEFSFITQNIPRQDSSGLVPKEFEYSTKVNVGPVEGSCRADHSFKVGDDLWFVERPPIRVKGRVSVLGRALESIIESRQ